MSTILMPVVTPFSFPLALAYVSRSAHEILDRVESTRGQSAGRRYQRLLFHDGRPLLCTITAAQDAALALAITAPDGSKGDDADWAWCAATLRHAFQLDRSLAGFYTLIERDPPLGAVIRRCYGLKPVLAATPFEALVWAITGQQITTAFAFVLKRRLVEQFGPRAVVNDTLYYDFPPPAALAAADIPELRALGYSANKARTVLTLAREVASGHVMLDADPADPAAIAAISAQLLALPGIGPWTLAYFLLRGLGHPDMLPAADLGLRDAIAAIYGLPERPTEAQVRALGARWAGWRSYATFYFWFARSWDRAALSNDRDASLWETGG
jgi:DNA-3-methyladenine glycosylase II